LTNK